MARETTVGWIGSIVFHLVAAAILFFVRPSQPEPQQQEFVELSIGGGLASSLGPMPKGEVLPLGSQPSATPGSTAMPGDEGKPAEGVGVDAPSMKNIAPSEEVVSMPPTKKMSASDNPVPTFGGTKGVADAQREPSASSSTPGFPEGKEGVVGKPGAPNGSEVAPPFNEGGVGGSIASNVSYDVKWVGGGRRDLVSGDLPKYPAGVNVNAQIKLRVVVQPRGTVKAVQPLRKGDTRLEDAAIREVRSWRFQSLLRAEPALDQICTIIFNFKVK
jgi:outer membrane biosynthesis protein TonB